MTTTYTLDGVAAPPMVNGELVFDAPWQGRIFGMARGLAEQGIYQWGDFRARLIEQIAVFDRNHQSEAVVMSGASTPQYRYYDHFLRALETLLAERGLIAAGELTDRIGKFVERPHGHDHHHDHDHDHDHDHADDHDHHID